MKILKKHPFLGTGKVNLEVLYTSPKSENEKHCFAVTIHSASGLFKEKSKYFVS